MRLIWGTKGLLKGLGALGLRGPKPSCSSICLSTDVSKEHWALTFMARQFFSLLFFNCLTLATKTLRSSKLQKPCIQWYRIPEDLSVKEGKVAEVLVLTRFWYRFCIRKFYCIYLPWKLQILSEFSGQAVLPVGVFPTHLCCYCGDVATPLAILHSMECCFTHPSQYIYQL